MTDDEDLKLEICFRLGSLKICTVASDGDRVGGHGEREPQGTHLVQSCNIRRLTSPQTVVAGKTSVSEYTW